MDRLQVMDHQWDLLLDMDRLQVQVMGSPRWDHPREVKDTLRLILTAMVPRKVEPLHLPLLSKHYK
jgi:hypothetical protein